MPKIQLEQIKRGDRVRVRVGKMNAVLLGSVTEVSKAIKFGCPGIRYTLEGVKGDFWAHLDEVMEVLPQPWREGCGADLRAVFQEKHGGDPLADILLALDHQLSTDSDLDEITGAAKYQALRAGIKETMAVKLGYAGVVR